MRVVGRGSAWHHVEDAHRESWGTVLCRDHLADLHAIGQSLILAWRHIVIGLDYHTSSLSLPNQPLHILPSFLINPVGERKGDYSLSIFLSTPIDRADNGA